MNETFDKILSNEVRAEFCQICRCLWAMEFQEKLLLRFTDLQHPSFDIPVTIFTELACRGT